MSYNPTDVKIGGEKYPVIISVQSMFTCVCSKVNHRDKYSLPNNSNWLAGWQFVNCSTPSTCPVLMEEYIAV